jgi:trehalose-6-phosphate synthase
MDAYLLCEPRVRRSVLAGLQALVMPLEERRARHKNLYAAICEYDVHKWQREFLTALRGNEGCGGVQRYAFKGELANSERLTLDRLAS